MAEAGAEAAQVEAQLAEHLEREAALEKEIAQKDRRLQVPPHAVLLELGFKGIGLRGRCA